MKHLVSTCIMAAIISAIATGCAKSNGTYSSGPDHSTGMTNERKWTGTCKGYTKGDTVMAGDTTHIAWPKKFSRNITDTPAAVIRLNDFTVDMLGTVLNWVSTDPATKVVTYDVLLSGASAKTVLKFDPTTKIMTYEYHYWGSKNASTGTYYYTDMFLTSSAN